MEILYDDRLKILPPCSDFFIEEKLALMELRFIVCLHIVSRAVYIGSTRLYVSGKGGIESESREK